MSDYARKINALLDKASATEHPEERETFLKAAERLMVKWGVDDATLAASKASSAPRATIEERRYQAHGVYAAALALRDRQKDVDAEVGGVRMLKPRANLDTWSRIMGSAQRANITAGDLL